MVSPAGHAGTSHHHKREELSLLEPQTRPRSRLRTTLGTTKKSRSMELPSLRHDQSFMLLVCGQAMVSMYVFVTHIFAYILVLGIRNVPVD